MAGTDPVARRAMCSHPLRPKRSRPSQPSLAFLPCVCLPVRLEPTPTLRKFDSFGPKPRLRLWEVWRPELSPIVATRLVHGKAPPDPSRLCTLQVAATEVLIQTAPVGLQRARSSTWQSRPPNPQRYQGDSRVFPFAPQLAQGSGGPLFARCLQRCLESHHASARHRRRPDPWVGGAH